MKKIIFNILICFLVVITIGSSMQIVNANFYEAAYNWFQQGSEDEPMQNAMEDIINPIKEYIKILGTAIITIATIVIGIRYIFASAEGKSLAKENLINLLVACILFYGWSNIEGMLFSGTKFVLYQSSDFKTTVGWAFAIFKFFAQAVAVVGIIYVGLKYIFAGAQGKADLKGKSFPFIVGLILTFSTFEVLNIVSDIIVK